MSDINFKVGWLKDPADNQKFAPKTTTNQVLTGDGNRLTDALDNIQTDMNTHKTEGDIHVGDLDRENWNAAYNHSTTSHVTGVKGNAETTYRIGNVNITPANIGLGNVNNTSDANKPVSTAQQTAINVALTNATQHTDTLKNNLIDGNVIPYQSHMANIATTDSLGNTIHTTYETKSDATSKYNELNSKVEKVIPFTATYNQTTYNEIKAAHDSGRLVQVKTTELIPGAYDENGNLLHTWEEMIAIWTEAGYGDIENSAGDVYPPYSLITIVYQNYSSYPSHIVIPEDVNMMGEYVLSYYEPENGTMPNMPEEITITFLGTPIDVSQNIIYTENIASTTFIFNFPTFTQAEGDINGIESMLSYIDGICAGYTVNYLYDLSQYELNIPYCSQLISSGNEFVFRGHIKSGDIEYVCSNSNGWSTRNIQVMKLGNAQMKYDYTNRRIVFSFS